MMAAARCLVGLPAPAATLTVRRCRSRLRPELLISRLSCSVPFVADGGVAGTASAYRRALMAVASVWTSLLTRRLVVWLATVVVIDHGDHADGDAGSLCSNSHDRSAAKTRGFLIAIEGLMVASSVLVLG